MIFVIYSGKDDVDDVGKSKIEQSIFENCQKSCFVCGGELSKILGFEN